MHASLDFIEVGDIHFDGQGFPSHGDDFRGYLFCFFHMAVADNRDMAAGSGQRQAMGYTQSVRATGNQGYLAFNTHYRSPLFFRISQRQNEGLAFESYSQDDSTMNFIKTFTLPSKHLKNSD